MDHIEECGMSEMPVPAPMEQHEGSPVSMNVSLNASGKEHVEDLLNMMKNAGMPGAKEVGPMDMPKLPMRTDIDKFRSIVDGPKPDGDIDFDLDKDGSADMKLSKKLPAPKEMDMEDDVEEEGYDNEPDEQYGALDDVIDSGDDLHKSKKAHRAVAGGDNAMTLEQEILKALKADYAAKK